MKEATILAGKTKQKNPKKNPISLKESKVKSNRRRG